MATPQKDLFSTVALKKIQNKHGLHKLIALSHKSVYGANIITIL